jgi:oligosaccharide amylase
MPRSLTIGNGKVQANFDADYVLRDFFYPHVGQENHFAGEKCRTGVWSNDRFAWEQDRIWEKRLGYVEDTLVTQVRLYHPQWRLELVFNDAIDLAQSVLFRRVTVTNHSEQPQEIRLFFHYDFHIYGSEVGNTILYDPHTQTMMAYKGRRYFLADVQNSHGPGVHSWAIGVTEVRGREGTWRDAEDGHLQENPIAQGSVDGTIALDMDTIEPGRSATGHHWLIAGEARNQTRDLDVEVRKRGPDSYIDRTRDWWIAWRQSDEIDFYDLDTSTRSLYARSLLTIRTHVDDGGAIIAATDWDIISYSWDTYAYCWPRDGALVAMALDRAGYGELARRFFTFCRQVLDPYEGYFLHKFTPMGDLASSWHPWMGPDKQPQLPIQEDETGLVLMALWRHYQTHRDIEFIKLLYRPVIRATADFMIEYRNKKTRLPLPSYDLWEERHGVHAYTIASVWAGLDAAARFAHTFNQQEVSDACRQAAEEIKNAALVHLWDDEKGYFSRMLLPSGGTSYGRDSILDASILALSLYGMLDPNDPKMRATAEAIHSRLWCKTPVGGLARYENDTYQQASQDTQRVPGNPWFICTLWLAQYYISAAESRADLDKAKGLLRWVEQRVLPGGLLAEQAHPYSGAPISVAPLSWSHAEYVTTVHDYFSAYRRLG